MASKDYLPLFWAARKAHLGNIAQTSKEIKRLYREAADDLAARAAASRQGSLSERWASDYAESLSRRVAELEAGLYDVTLQGLKRSAELPSMAMGQWWEMVGGQSFRDAFALPPDNILAGIIEGGFYKDNKGLSERIWRIADSFEKDIAYIVNRGIAEKKSVLEFSRDLEQYVKPPAKRDFDWGKVYPDLSGRKVDFNAQRLARTSINHSYFLDNVRVCTENPFVESMHWDLSNAHEERQVIPFGPDECDEYAEHDEGLGLGNFKPEEIPVPHPQCLCVQWAVIPQSLEEIGAQIGRWASGEPDAVLDEWYARYGDRNPNGDPKEILREGLKYQGNDGIIKTERQQTIKNIFEKGDSSDAVVDGIINNHDALAEFTPASMKAMLESLGYEVRPLGKQSRLHGVPFEEGGGYRTAFYGDGYFQYHPEDKSHHGGAYWKVRNGKVVKRYDMDGNEKDD